MSMNGIVIIDKPEGITSFKVVSEVRKNLNIKKVGHMGTLDPMASGVLPIMIGTATKALDLISNHNKKYIAKMKLGISTDTQDITGKIIDIYDKKICFQEFKDAVCKFKGEIEQIPPMYSAIKKDGVRLYEIARQGKTIDREARKIFIEDINIIEFNENDQEAILSINCSRGTYIRSLCADIGAKLGSGAAMTYLRRIKSNGFDIEDSLTLDEFKRLCNDGIINNKIISIDRIFRDLVNVEITKNQAIRFINGGALLLSRVSGIDAVENNMKVAIYREKSFIGLGEVNLNKNEILVLKVFNRDI